MEYVVSRLSLLEAMSVFGFVDRQTLCIMGPLGLSTGAGASLHPERVVGGLFV